MQFEFASPARVIFGEGAIQNIGTIASSYGKKALVITGKGGASPELLCDLLGQHRIEWSQVEVAGEPTIAFVGGAISHAKDFGTDVVIAYGGGSVLDTGKAISAMLTNPGELLDYLEVVGRGQLIVNQAAACIAIPTTAGTGSEVTRNAVLGVPDKQMKVSMRSPLMLPRVALVDPELTYSLPPAVTASTGMDAITQVLEPYVSIRSNPMADLFCREGLQRGPQALLAAYKNGSNQSARQAMAWTSLMGGMALANAGLGAVHGFASPIGGMFEAPHGAVCARLLAPVTAMNIRALSSREPHNPALGRYTDIGKWLTGDPAAELADGVRWLEELSAALSIPPLSTYGITEGDVAEIVEKAAVASSMKANPIQLSEEELSSILRSAL